jgi:F-type H+-transporting ATPase subunit epsilon
MRELPLQVSLLTPERVLFEGGATGVTVPGHDGEIGILKGHMTMVARLGAGVARIHTAEGMQRTFVSGGFVQVSGTSVTILSDDAHDPATMDVADAQHALDEALAMAARGEDDLGIKQRSLELARARLRVARRS